MVQNAGIFLKNRRNERCERVEKGLFPYFLACIFARMVRKLEPHCKIKSNNLRFCVDELVRACVDVSASWRVYLLTNL